MYEEYEKSMERLARILRRVKKGCLIALAVLIPAAAEDNTPATPVGEGWAEIREMLFDDAAVKLADALEEKGIGAPEEAGYELANDSGEVIAEIELAWISRKVGYLTEEQTADRENAESAGWTIFTTADEIDTVFGEG